MVNQIWVMYANGLGRPKDYEEAVKWYIKAADQRHAGAESHLGEMSLLRLWGA